MFGKVFPGSIWEWPGSLIFVIKHEGEFPPFYDWRIVAFTTSLENIKSNEITGSFRRVRYSSWMFYEFLLTFMPNAKREFVPRDQVFPLIVVYCVLLLLEKQFHASFIHKIMDYYFLFWDILNLNLTFAVCHKRHS